MGVCYLRCGWCECCAVRPCNDQEGWLGAMCRMRCGPVMAASAAEIAAMTSPGTAGGLGAIGRGVGALDAGAGIADWVWLAGLFKRPVMRTISLIKTATSSEMPMAMP